MKIFVISLKKETQKRAIINNTLHMLGVNYEIYDAVDGRTDLEDIRFNIYSKWHEPTYKINMTNGEIGCALSHLNIWKKIVDENIESAIILEDDFIVNDPDFVNTVNNIDFDYDLVYLGRKKMGIDNEEQINEKVVKPIFSYWTIGYVLTTECAKKLYNETYLNNLFPVDEYLPLMYNKHSNTDLIKLFKNCDKINCYAFEPPLLKPNADAFTNSLTFSSKPYNYYNSNILVLTVATDNNDALKRYAKSCNYYGYDYKILGLGNKWRGGNMEIGPGGGQKVNLLKAYFNETIVDDNKLIIFTDSYDVIGNNHSSIVYELYENNYKNKIVFASEYYLWPDTTLIDKYPNSETKTKYLNSGLFIGYAKDIKNILKTEINDMDDDQLYYTNIFLENEEIILDYDCKMFLCMNGIISDIVLEMKEMCIKYNNNRPCFVHANGGSDIKLFLNSMSNYCFSGWNDIYTYKCIENFTENELPSVLICVYETIDVNNRFINGINNIDYPKDKINILYFGDSVHLDNLNKDFNNITYVKKQKDTSFKLIDNYIKFLKCEKVFYIETSCVLHNKKVLINLLKEKRNYISPLIIKKGSFFSNVWGDLDNKGFYKRSFDYIDYINGRVYGCMNVPYAWSCMLIDSHKFNSDYFYDNVDKGEGYDMAFCYNIRKNNDYIFMLNNEKYGELIEDVKIDIFNDEWEEKYLSKDFYDLRNNLEKIIINEPIDDVLKIQVFNKTFCDEIIQKSEEYGEWSKGNDTDEFDKRLGNKENVPTQDIHLKEIGLENIWGNIVDKYISKIIYNCYALSTKEINISFIVKYSMDGQKELKPHHDSSTYTCNICLNNDFEGGGCHFIKKDKKICNNDIGSIIIHPGKMTHLHRGIPITNGKRYILVSFIN